MRTYTPSDYKDLHKIKNLPTFSYTHKIDVEELITFLIRKIRQGSISLDLVRILASLPFFARFATASRRKVLQERLLVAVVDFITGLQNGYNKKLTKIVSDICSQGTGFTPCKRNSENFINFVSYYFTEPYTPRQVYFEKYFKPENEKKMGYFYPSYYRNRLFTVILPEEFPKHPVGKILLPQEKFYRYVVATEYLWRRSRIFVRKKIFNRTHPYEVVATSLGLPDSLVKKAITAFFDAIISSRYRVGDTFEIKGFEIHIERKMPYSLLLRIMKKSKAKDKKFMKKLPKEIVKDELITAVLGNVAHELLTELMIGKYDRLSLVNMSKYKLLVEEKDEKGFVLKVNRGF